MKLLPYLALWCVVSCDLPTPQLSLPITTTNRTDPADPGPRTTILAWDAPEVNADGTPFEPAPRVRAPVPLDAELLGADDA